MNANVSLLKGLVEPPPIAVNPNLNKNSQTSKKTSTIIIEPASTNWSNMKTLVLPKETIKGYLVVQVVLISLILVAQPQ